MSLVIRGANLAAVREQGLTLLSGRDRFNVQVAASDRPSDFGPQDLVICTLKSNMLTALADGVAPLLAAETPILFAQNGIPWWYAHGAPQAPHLPDLDWLDPGQVIAKRIGLARTLGGVIFSANEMMAPGVVRNETPKYNALFVGPPNCSASGPVPWVRAALNDVGIVSPDIDDLRKIMWRKLALNLSTSLLCMVTGQSAREASEDPVLGPVAKRLMTETIAIAASQGYHVPRLPPAYRAPDHKPALLQDYSQHRSMEIDALVKAPLSFARAAGLETPTLDTLGALAERLAIEAGLYTSAPRAG